jgi:glycosyltransferase involved in cell wall biosynthesis
MRIALVHSAYSRTLPSGENFVVSAQAELLNTLGHEVLLIQAETDELSLKLLYKLRSMIRVAFGIGHSPFSNLSKFNPDVVLIHNLYPNFGSSWIRKLKKKQKNVIILSIVHNFRYICASGNLLRNGKHCNKCITDGPVNSLIYRCYRNSFFYTIPWFIAKVLQVSKRNILDTVDAMVFLSAATVAEFVKAYPQKIRYDVLPNFVPNNKVDYIGGDLASKNGKWVVVGRLSVEKGIAKLIENWPDELQLDIFGNGPELPRIQKLIKAKPNITLEGKVSASDLEKLLPQYLGAIHCSLWIEIAPLTVLEFKRAGLPIIYTGNNFTPFSTDVPIIGIKLEKYESRYLIKACENILQNYREASDQSRKAYLQHYSGEAWISKFESLIRDLQSHKEL